MKQIRNQFLATEAEEENAVAGDVRGVLGAG